MVKRPQTQIGYFVGGELVHRPSQRIIPNSSHYVREKHPGGLRLQRYPKHKVKNAVNRWKLHNVGETWTQDLGIKKGLYDDEVKNNVKVNNMNELILIINKSLRDNKGMWWVMSRKAFQTVVTRLLFKKNIEQRRPLYYACLCGHPKMVEFLTGGKGQRVYASNVWGNFQHRQYNIPRCSLCSLQSLL